MQASCEILGQCQAAKGKVAQVLHERICVTTIRRIFGSHCLLTLQAAEGVDTMALWVASPRRRCAPAMSNLNLLIF